MCAVSYYHVYSFNSPSLVSLAKEVLINLLHATLVTKQQTKLIAGEYIQHLPSVQPDISLNCCWRPKQSWKKSDFRSYMCQVARNTNKYVPCFARCVNRQHVVLPRSGQITINASLNISKIKCISWHHGNIWPQIKWDILSGTNVVNNYKFKPVDVTIKTDCLRLTKMSSLNSIWWQYIQ